MVYKSRWRRALVTAVVLHAAAGVLFAAAAPMLFPKPPVVEMTELEWASAGGGADGNGGDMGTAGADAVKAEGTMVAETAVPVAEATEDIYAVSEETAPASGDEVPAVKTETVTASDAPVRTAASREEAERAIERSTKGGGTGGTGGAGSAGGTENPITIFLNSGGGPSMGRSAKLVHAEYPAAGTATYRGRVNISACIGTDGRVRYAEVVHSSGSALVDAIAMQCAKKWVYRPATDSNGAPIECNAMISVPFREKKAK